MLTLQSDVLRTPQTVLHRIFLIQRSIPSLAGSFGSRASHRFRDAGELV